MTYSPENYDFEKFPRGNLLFRFDRRQFFIVIANEIKAVKELGSGKASYKLSELGNLPDEHLARIVPTVVPKCKISESDGFVWGQPSSSVKPVKLFPVSSPAMSGFKLFNGSNTLGLIGRQFAEEMNWEPNRGFAFIRGLFLHLVTLEVCVPI